MKVETSIRELSQGTVAIVVGFDRAYGGYIGKLLMKGLTPGTAFIASNVSLPAGFSEIILPTKILRLSKPEVDALCVEPITYGEES
ncbi:FeoA family protein [Myxosarcina sp. GI1(2024)]